MKKIIILSVFFSLFLASCEYEIDYNGQLADDKFVVAAFLEEDSTVNFTISHSAKPGMYLEYEQSPRIENADVNMYVNDQWKEKLSYNSLFRMYSSTYRPQHNDKISFTIENERYGKAEGSTRMNLTNPMVDSISAHITVVDEEDRLVLYIEIQDDGGENYYMLLPDLKYCDDMVDVSYVEVLQESVDGVFFEKSAVTSVIGKKGYNEYGVFNNNKFRNQKFVLKLSYYLNRWYDDFIEDDKKHIKSDDVTLKGSVVLAKIDKNAYEYLYTLSNVVHSIPVNTSPMYINNSVSNAYGFVGNKKTIKFNITDILQEKEEK
ncbi:MAG: DUF4249 domain-containing protein [Bacteroidales bacterium]|nr:DUF4249 domain-containing protein [Bacteroidales bacterium]